MALTRITKGVIKPNENYDTHNINSTGIVTAIGLDVNGNGDISGNLSVGGVLTYEDVTSIDSVGIITARDGIHVGAGVSAVGVGTFGGLDVNGNGDVSGNLVVGSLLTASGLDINGDIDVDGHTNLDNVSIAGVTTMSGNLTISNTDPQLAIHDTNHNPSHYYLKGVGGAFKITDSTNGDRLSFNANGSTSATATLFNIVGGAQVSSNLGVTGNLILTDNIIHDGDTNTKIRFPATDTISMETAGSERLRINSNGYIGINTNSPSKLVTIKADAPFLRLEAADTSDKRLDLQVSTSGIATISAEQSSQQLSFRTTGGEALRIDSSGRLLVKGASSNNAFSGGDDLIVGNSSGSTRSGITIVSNSSQDGGLYFSDGTSVGNAHVVGQIVYDHDEDHMRFFTNILERLRINSSGNVQVNGGALHLDASGELAVFETDTNLAFTNSAKLAFDYSGNIARIRSSHNGSGTTRNLGFYHANSQKLLITSDKVMFSADAKVDANNSRDLGASGAKWKTLYLGTQLNITGQGASNATPRLLIEDGTGGDNDFSISQYEDANGTYTLIGQNVQLNGGGNETILDSNHKTASIYLDARNNGAIFFNTGGTNTHTERLRIDSTGALGLGVGGITSYFKNNSGNYRQLQIGLGAHFYGRTDDTQIYLVSNGYRDGSNWKYTANTTASQITMGTNMQFFTAGAGTAGNNISFNERIRLVSNGQIIFGEANTSPVSDLEVRRANDGGDVAIRIGNNTGTNSGSTASLYFTTSPTQNFNTAYIQAVRDGGKLNFGYSTNDPTFTMNVSQNKVGITNTSPECRSGGIDMSSNDGTSGKTFTDMRGYSNLIIRNPNTDQHGFTQLLFENGGGNSAATMFRHRLGPSHGPQQNFVGDLCLFRRTGNAGGSNNDFRESTRFCGATEQARQIWWASGDTDTNGTSRLGWHHLSASNDQPGTDAYTFFRLETGAAAYARNGFGKYTCVWTTGHASGYGIAIGHFGYYMPHGYSTIIVNEHIIHRERYSNGSYYAWDDTPNLRIINNTASGGTNAAISFRCGGRRSSGFDMGVVVGLFIDLYVPESANGDTNPRLYVAGDSESNLSGGGHGNPVSHAYMSIQSSNPNHGGQP